MASDIEKYNKVVDLLKKSKPALDTTEDIEKEVIKRISGAWHPGIMFSELIDFLFGWVYIGWVRRSLICASVALVMVFVYQQTIILKRIDYLSKQTIVSERDNEPVPEDKIEKMLTVYKNSGRRFPSNNITISERQMKELLESVKELQVKYKDLENLIERDPELKKMIEKELNEKNSNKINL